MEISATMGTQENEEVRTLFVSGLPMDTKPREVYLLFRTYEGYQGSFLKLISSRPGKPPQPMAFVSFCNRKQAENALKDLHGIRFDPANPQTLRLEFARSNSRLLPNQSPQNTAPPSRSAPTNHQSPVYSCHPSNMNGVYGYYWMPNTAFAQFTPQQEMASSPSPGVYNIWSDYIQMPVVPVHPVSRFSSPSPTLELSPAATAAHLSAMNILSDSDSYMYNSQGFNCGYSAMNPSTPCEMEMATPPSLVLPGPVPCSTLFVANLEPHHTEEEIHTVFSSCEGFVEAKLLSRGGSPVAFAEFKDEGYASKALESLSGYVLPSSKRKNGIRIEYARQRMGEVNSPSSSQESQGDTTPPIEFVVPPCDRSVVNVPTCKPLTTAPDTTTLTQPRAIPVQINSEQSTTLSQHYVSQPSSIHHRSQSKHAAGFCARYSGFSTSPLSMVYPGASHHPVFVNRLPNPVLP